jgi:hypothetical protein
MSLTWKLRFLGRRLGHRRGHRGSVGARLRLSRPGYDEVRDFVLAQMPRGAVAAEIGVDQGRFSERILRISRPSRLYLIDPWLPDPTGRRPLSPEDRYQNARGLLAEALAGGVAVLLRETSDAAVERFRDNSLDWIYIDGAHRNEFVMRDLEQFVPKMRPGGFVICDDYHYAGTWEDGVTRAVDEFMTRGLTRKIFKRRSQFVMRRLH